MPNVDGWLFDPGYSCDPQAWSVGVDGDLFSTATEFLDPNPNFETSP